MESYSFHGNQIYVERETGLEPATSCLEDTADKRREPSPPFRQKDILDEKTCQAFVMMSGSYLESIFINNFVVYHKAINKPIGGIAEIIC